ncbi:MAG: nucleotidyltransferase domain-containing protein [Anaerolineae bacterium]|nr:nucleotidyltransferase domain-containing protein [Anaerolineae bacterium]
MQLPDSFIGDLEEACSTLVKHGARRIILYGSPARGDFRADSDIDLCVEGLSPDKCFRAIAACMMRIDRPISILDYRDLHGYLKERILAEGKILYDQGRVATWNWRDSSSHDSSTKGAFDRTNRT